MELVAAGLADKPRLLALAAGEAFRRARQSLRTFPITRWRPAVGVPAVVLPITQSFREGDPAFADAIYEGWFAFGGRTVETGGRSPFELEPPSAEWAAELHSFEWLRHLEAAGDALAAANARVLLSDWIAHGGRRRHAAAFDPAVVARRILAWLASAAFLLGEGDAVFRRRFARSLAAQLRFLRQAAPEAPDGLPRLRARIALAYGALCLRSGSVAIRFAARHLGDELDAQIFADGVHVSRDPGAIPLLLADLLPLASLFDAENQPVPRGLVTAVDRMLPMLRFFRHGDGALALFNGAKATDGALVTRLMRHDQTLGDSISLARQGGYARLSAGGTVVIADVGPPPRVTASNEAHAGTLAFEFSSHNRRIVVNCGAPSVLDDDLRQMARATAAHSTLTLADHSSSRFQTSDAVRRFLGTPLIAGPSAVPAAVEADESGTRVVAAHDGYASRFGVGHERTIFVARDGARIEGVDRLSGVPRLAGRAGQRLGAAIRFHLHPDVEAEWSETGIRLARGGAGEFWSFSSSLDAGLEDSLFLGGPDGPRRSRQIVIAFDIGFAREIAWRFERLPRSCPTADAFARQSKER